MFIVNQRTCFMKSSLFTTIIKLSLLCSTDQVEYNSLDDLSIKLNHKLNAALQVYLSTKKTLFKKLNVTLL